MLCIGLLLGYIKNMKKIITISELKIGMFVSAITKSKSKLVVKSQGMIRSQSIIESLASRGILECEIDFSKSQLSDSPQKASQSGHEKPPQNTSKVAIGFEQHQQDLAAADKLYTEAREIQSKFIKQLRDSQAPDFDALNKLSQDIIDSVFDNQDALSCLVMLKESNDYLIQHALNCSILMTLFAKYKDVSQAQIEDLTLAGLLMDCGMAALPSELMECPETLSEADHSLMRTHVDIGFEIAERFSDLPPIVLDIIANHHEHIDGSGYPRGLEHGDISLFAQMAAIVDNYDALISHRESKSSLSAQQALETLQHSPKYDTNLLNDFIKTIGLFPVGSLVHLQSDKLAIVVQRNATNTLRPIVMSFYNIKDKHDTKIERIDLKHNKNEYIIASVRPEEFDINLPSFFRSSLLAS